MTVTSLEVIMIIGKTALFESEQYIAFLGGRLLIREIKYL